MTKKTFVRFVLKRMNKEQRRHRIVFVGRRLKVLQYYWLHFNLHPWDTV